MHHLPLIAALVCAVVSTAVSGDGLVFVPGRTGSAGMLTVTWDGASTNLPLAVVAQENKGVTNRLDDAALEVGGFVTWYVRPRLKAYQSDWQKKTTKAGQDIVARWDELPKASEHGFRFDFDARDDGDLAVWMDGSYVGKLPRPAGAIGRARAVVTPTAAGRVSPRTDARRTDARFEPLQLASNPRAGAFAAAELSGVKVGLQTIDGIPLQVVSPRDSQDAGLCCSAQRVWALYIDEYRARSPADGYPAAIHFRLPSDQYLKAHVLVAFDAAKGKTRRFSAVQSVYEPNDGTGDNRICTADADFSKGVPAGFRQVGEVVLGGVRTPLYFGTVTFDLGPYVDLASSSDFIDFELNGTDVNGESTSGANFFAVTLEKTPCRFEMAQRTPGNVFTRDETRKLTGVRLCGNADFAGEVVWCVGERTERIPVGVKAGETRDYEIDLSDFGKVGLYDLEISLVDRAGARLFRHPARFCIAPDAGRLSDRNIVASPYFWWWFNRHGVPTDPDFGGPLMQKAGVHKVGYIKLGDEAMRKYNLTTSGNVTISPWHTWPDPNFDMRAGKFKDRKGETGEEWFVRTMKEKIARAGRVDRALVWHESAPANHIPEEVLGLPVPAATEADREAARYVNEIGRLMRRHFPEIRIEIGNWLESYGAATSPFRGGANPDFVDAVAIESLGFLRAPERINSNPVAALVVKEAAEKAAGRPIRINACYEYTSRSSKLLGDDRATAWRLRDTIIGLAYGFDLLMVGSPSDVCNGYYSSPWGSGDCTRAPYAYPKKKYLATAVLTKCLDAVTFRRLVPTGSATVYAAEFARADGKFVTALWTARGEAEVEMNRGAFRIVSMLGEEREEGGWLSRARFWISGEPTYVIADGPIGELKIVARRFADEERLFARGGIAAPLASSGELVATRDDGYQCEDIHHFPLYRRSDDFTLSDANDEEMGKCVEVRLDVTKRPMNRYYTEYAKFDLATPVPIPAKANWIGMRVKGNSNWGQIRFEVEDAKGKRFRFWLRRTKDEFDRDFYDQAGTTCVNFDGWGFVHFPLGQDKDGCGWGWQRFAGGGDWRQTKPLKLTSVMISMNREKLGLLGFSPAEPRLLIKDIFWSEEPAR